MVPFYRRRIECEQLLLMLSGEIPLSFPVGPQRDILVTT